jgi:hypothetical protein
MEDIVMTDNQKRILEMLAEKKISTEEAYRLLNALDRDEGGQSETPRVQTGTALNPKYLRVTVTPKEGADPEHADRVNVRVPMSLVRAGIKLTSLIPHDATDKINDALREKGINFDVRNIKAEDIEELIYALGELEVDVETGHGEKVKVFVEY